MPRYQPPIINGGDRNNPTWSELAAYYLPREEGQNRGGPNAQIPMLSSPTAIGDPRILEQYRQMYRDPYAPLQSRDRGTTPSPWSGGGSAYDEIMNRLRSRGPAIPTIPTETAVAAPQAQRPSLISHEDARAYGFPEGWRNGQPGGGAIQAMIGHRNMLAQQQAAQSGGSYGAGPSGAGMGSYVVPGAAAQGGGYLSGSMQESGGGPVQGGQAWGARPQGQLGPGPGGMGFSNGGGYSSPGEIGGSSGGYGDPYGEGGRDSPFSGRMPSSVGGLVGGPIGALAGAMVSGWNTPSNPLLGSGNFENESRVGRNFMGPEAPGQGRQGRNPWTDFLDWLREKISNE